MSITIQEAIKAMENGKKAKCLDDGVIYTYDSADGSFSTYQIESEWEIVEQEEEPKPCLFCRNDKTMEIHNFSHFGYKVVCKKVECNARSPYGQTKEEAARKHNEIYRKLHGEKKESENLKNDIKEVYEWLTENLQYINTAYERDYKSGALDRIKSMMHLMETYFRNIINKDK